jgi:hypothetical protein
MMKWFFVTAIGMIIGTVMNSLWHALNSSVRLPRLFCVTIGALGALVGGVLASTAQSIGQSNPAIGPVGSLNFYLISILLSIGFVSGALLDYYLTGKEKGSN